MVRLEEELERTSKYLKRWVKRFVSFDDGFKRMSYGTSKYRIKRTMRVTAVARVSDVSHSIPPNTGEPYEVIVDGVMDNGEHTSWTLRMPDVNSFNLWYITLRNSLSEPGAFSSARFTTSVAGPSPSQSSPTAAAAAANVPTTTAASTSSPPSPSITATDHVAKNEFRERLVRFYDKYAPDKLRHVDNALAQYKGKERIMFATLVAKYGPEPPYIEAGAAPPPTKSPVVRASHSVNNSFGEIEDFEEEERAAAAGSSPPKPPGALVAKNVGVVAADGRGGVVAATVVEVPADSIRASHTVTIEAQHAEINNAPSDDSIIESLDISIDSDDI